MHFNRFIDEMILRSDVSHMARKRKSNSNPQVELLEEKIHLYSHIRQLGLTNVQDYQAWCTAQGLSPKLNKSDQQRQHEVSRMHHLAAQARQKSMRRLRRDPLSVLIEICDGLFHGRGLLRDDLERFHNLLNRRGKQGEPAIDRQALKRLLTHLAKVRCKLLDDVSDRTVHYGEDSHLEAIARLAAHQAHWLRPPETWRPSSKNARRQFISLTQHLLARYDMPMFMLSAWFDSRHRMAPRYRCWYVHLAQGGRLRDCALPIVYTKRMAHCFMQAPDDLTVSQAVRWGQVIGLGGDVRLAREIVATRLGERFEHDDFWCSVVRWFVANPMLDPVHINPIIDYLRHQRFVPVDIQVGDQWQQQPQQPNLSMKGRTAATLIRQVEGWHQRLSRSNLIQVQQWKSTGLPGLFLTEGQPNTSSWRQWSIRELVSSGALVAEGRAMQHCVASYTASCARGQTSIWTLEQRTLGGQEKCVTIEVMPSGRYICQIRGRRNRLATEQELRVIHHWAEQQDLKVAAYLG